MAELLKLWPPFFSLISFVVSACVSGYVLWAMLWIKKEITEPLSSLKEHTSDSDHDLKLLHDSFCSLKNEVLQHNQEVSNELKSLLSTYVKETNQDITNLWRTKTDTTVFDTKLRNIEDKLDSYQKMLMNFLMQKGG
jgi:hypothetical protein